MHVLVLLCAQLMFGSIEQLYLLDVFIWSADKEITPWGLVLLHQLTPTCRMNSNGSSNGSFSYRKLLPGEWRPCSCLR